MKVIIQKKKQKSTEKRSKYNIRKLSVGVVSCVVGYLVFISPIVAYAEGTELPQKAVIDSNLSETWSAVDDEVRYS